MATWQPSSSAARSSRQRPLPQGYVSIRDILEESVPVGRIVSVIGLVKDRRVPMQTGRTDWKSVLTIYDQSIKDELDRGLKVNIFRAQSEMPEPEGGDAVVIVSARVQSYRGEVSLITHWSTAIHVYSADKIPKPPKSAKQALQANPRPSDRPPGEEIHEFVSWLYDAIKKDAMPDPAEFTILVEQSRNIKNKFRVLSDVGDSQFCDVIVNVVRDPFDQMGTTTLWVSDYTENQFFYKFSWDATETPQGQDGDPYGYTTTKSALSKNWTGPYGKRSMQITCFGIHAEFINKEVKVGNWVLLRNLQVKYGRNGNNLEGFLREDRTAFASGLQVDLLTTDDPENIDDRLKDAIRRKRDYEKAKKKQLKSLVANEGGKVGKGGKEAAKGGGKRKVDDQVEGKQNSKLRRAEIRAQKFREVEEQEREKEAKIGLNEIIKCENLEQPVFAVSSIVEPIPWTTTVDNQEVTLTLPFTCAKYRANVRVVDFRPNKLANFATWRKNVEYDMLSDYSGGSDSGSDEDRSTLHRYAGEKIWEWRFALLLEEANPKHKGDCDRFWAVVDNSEAQLLLGLDASDLRANPDDLDKLREQLFYLWGDLEECKQQELQRQVTNKERVTAHQPPPTSPLRPSSSHQAKTKKTELAVSNKPFTCCIRQYGIEVPEENPKKANSGDGKRWERIFGLFGTKISP
ncbi:hypothetical protein F5Y13DRAFT_164679 [Hypoxylon sp. FL1857]|nr:hypothetical protein F5Y13DRAFT_164679 [Hypoxylon sp. FL1857]